MKKIGVKNEIRHGCFCFGNFSLFFVSLVYNVAFTKNNNIPSNAMAVGDRLGCLLGFKKNGNRCLEMTAAEKEEQIRQIKIQQALSKNETMEYDGEEFTLRDVERKCEVYRYSENYEDLECSGLKFIERKCEGYFSSESSKDGEIECRDSDLLPIERNCSVSMYS